MLGRSSLGACALAAALVAIEVAAPSPARADDAASAPWSLDSRSPSAVIYTRDDARAHARAFKGVGEVDAPPGVVFAVVTDVEAHPAFMPFITRSTIVQRLSPTETIVHQVISPPVIGTRDAFFRITNSPGATPASTCGSTWVAVPDYAPEREGFVRLRVAEGSWLFEPLDGGARSRVTYTSLTNVGGAVPGWMANTQTASVIRDMYDAIRKRVGGVAHHG
jgi:hypothetical protein